MSVAKVYRKRYCPNSDEISALLSSYGIHEIVTIVDKHSEPSDFSSSNVEFMIDSKFDKEFPHIKTLPYIVINDVDIGGLSDLKDFFGNDNY